MLNVRLAGDRLYVNLLFTRLSLVMSLIELFVLSYEMSCIRSGT